MIFLNIGIRIQYVVLHINYRVNDFHQSNALHLKKMIPNSGDVSLPGPPNRYTLSVKPILHCNVKLLALGRHVGSDPKCDHFALDITTFWYLKSLAHPTRSIADQT